MHKHTKRGRQRVLREIISQRGVGDQHHLQSELARRGVDITQATISRDLQEMGYIKTRLRKAFGGAAPRPAPRDV
jgi:transcriptional regulator of arginine metabolism